MNKKIKNSVIIIIILLLIFTIFKNNALYVNSFYSAIKLFVYKVFPFLFIMMILNGILVKCNLPYYLSRLKINKAFYIFIMSIFSGSPINAILLSDYLKNNIINENEASIILSFTTYNNPLFLYNYLLNITGNIKNVIKIMSIIYLLNLLLYFISIKFMNKNKVLIKYKNYKIKNELFEIINNSLINLLKIMGIIIFFKVITDVLLNGNQSIVTVLFKGIIEITQGLNELTNLKLSIKIKEIISFILITFSGLSIHMQMSLILEKYQINYKYFYLSRLFLITLGVTIILLL